MLDRVEMNVIAMAEIIGLISQAMFPIPRLPDATAFLLVMLNGGRAIASTGAHVVV